MAFNYNKMKATADRLINQFAQGSIEYEAVTTASPANPWDDPVETTVRVPIEGVVGGVSSEFLTDVAILSTDLQLISSSSIPAGSRVIIDGTARIIIRHDKIPAAGVTVANRYILR